MTGQWDVVIANKTRTVRLNETPIYVLIGSTSGIPEVMASSLDEQKMIQLLRDAAEGSSSRNDWDGKCDHTGKHFSEATHFFSYHKTEYRIDTAFLT